MIVVCDAGPVLMHAHDGCIDHPHRHGNAREAARADIVVVAVNWTKPPAALGGLADWGGRIVVDANNPIEAPLFKPVDLKGARLCKAVQKKKGT